MVHIEIVNDGKKGMPISVTLRDPYGKVCEDFAEAGTANLAPGESALYMGVWNVSETNLFAQELFYAARYTYPGVGGAPMEASRLISVVLFSDLPHAILNVDRSFWPARMVAEGEYITIVYRLINIGTIDFHDITFIDPDIDGGPVVLPLLRTGEVGKVAYHVGMGHTPRDSSAEIAYDYYDGAEKVAGTGKMDAVSLEVSDLSAWENETCGLSPELGGEAKTEAITAWMDATAMEPTDSGAVRVDIGVRHVNGGGEPVSVALYDPAGQVCAGFGKGGAARLAPGEAIAYRGEWAADEAQWSAGKVVYEMRYTLQEDARHVTRVIQPLVGWLTAGN